MDGRPKQGEGARLRRAIGRWILTAGGRAVFAVITCVLIAVAALWAVNEGSLPRQWRDTITNHLSESLGVPVKVDQVRLGVNRLVLHGVHVDASTSVTADHVVVGLSFRDLWSARRAPMEALRWVEIVGLRTELPDDVWRGTAVTDGHQDAQVESDVATGDGHGASESKRGFDIAALMEQLPADGELHIRLTDGGIFVPVASDSSGAPPTDSSGLEVDLNGNVVWRGGRLMLQRLLAEGTGWELTLNGPILPRLDVYARIVSEDVVQALAGLPEQMTGALPAQPAGRVDGEVWLTGDWQRPNAWGRLHWHDVRVGLPSHSHDQSAGVDEYTADEVVVNWAYRAARGIEVTVDAAHRVAKLRAEGTVNPADGTLQLTVGATDLDLPADVPVLARWNIDGRADFSGTLAGTITSPILSGTVASDGGHLFGQPFSGLQGFLELTDDQFSFERAHIAQGTAVYYLEGVIGFGSAADKRPGDLHLVLRTDRGRVEALTAVLGWDVPLQAGLAGTLTFAGPFGAVGAEGDITMTHGAAFGQSFDQLTGQFGYGDGEFFVTNVNGSLRGGVVTVQGGGLIDGPWELSVDVDDVPLQAISIVRDRLPTASGLVGFDGVVRSASDGGTPIVTGAVVGRHLQVGHVDFAAATGNIAYENGQITSNGLTLQRLRGATYAVTGQVAHVMREPVMDLSIDVLDESLADVLALAGLRTPVPVASGDVTASITLQGTVDDPEAHIRLEAPEVFVVGRRAALGIELRVKDGRIEVEQLNRAMTDGPLRDHAPGQLRT